MTFFLNLQHPHHLDYLPITPIPCVLQLRVIRAFKSTLEDLEERRSVHSLHSLHSLRSSRSHTGPRPLSDITYIDEDPVKTPSTNNTLALPKMVSPAEDPHRPFNSEGQPLQTTPKHLPDLAKITHETSI